MLKKANNQILGNCVTVARQTLTLFVGVRIPIPQPKNDNLRQKVVVFTFSLFTLHFSLKSLVVFLQVISNSE